MATKASAPQAFIDSKKDPDPSDDHDDSYEEEFVEDDEDDEDDLVSDPDDEEDPAEVEARAIDFVKIDPKTAHVSSAITEGISLISSLSIQLDVFEKAKGTPFIHWCILLGDVLNATKPLVKAEGLKFSDLVHEKVPYLGKRSIQDYMKPAKMKNAESWAFLGKNKLLEAADLLGGSEAEDPLGDLFQKHGLDKDQVMAMKPRKFRELWLKVKSGVVDESVLNLLRKKISDLEKDLHTQQKSRKLNLVKELESLRTVIDNFV